MNKMTRISIVVLAALAWAGLAYAESGWRASLGVGAEYTDNAGEEHDGEEDIITALRPSLSYNREGGRLLFQSAYSGDYRYYTRETEDEEFNHDLKMRALLEASEDFFFIDASETYRLVNEDRRRGDVREEDSTSELVQQNNFTFSPFITPRFGERTSARVGYAYTNIWYDDSDKDAKDIHRGFLDGDYELSDRASLLSGYSYAMELSEDDTLDRHIAYFGGHYEYSSQGDVYLKMGPQYSRYRDRGRSSTSLYWDAGLNHDFGAVLMNLSSGISFDDDPDTGETYERRYVTLALTKIWDRTTARLSASLEDYEESADGSRSSDESDDLESTRRTVFGLNVSHELSARLTGTFGLGHDFDDSDDNTKRWYANLGLTYALSETLNLSAWYRFKDSSSDDIDEDYRVNRVGVQLTYLF